MDWLLIGISVAAFVGMAALGIIILRKKGTDDTQGVEMALDETLDRRRPIEPLDLEAPLEALDEAVKDGRKYREGFND